MGIRYQGYRKLKLTGCCVVMSTVTRSLLPLFGTVHNDLCVVWVCVITKSAEALMSLPLHQSLQDTTYTALYLLNNLLSVLNDSLETFCNKARSKLQSTALQKSRPPCISVKLWKTLTTRGHTVV